jgi:large subunit ribosomal protein L3
MKKYNRSGILAKKVGVSSLYQDDGVVIPVTLLSLEGCRVVQSTKDLDNNRCLIQVGSGVAKNVSKPLAGHFKKNGVKPVQKMRSFCVGVDFDLAPGSVFRADYFAEGGFVDVAGTSIGCGFAGAMKRHGFGGLRASHGVSVSHRSHGSTGNRKFPARVFKGKKMAGHMGAVRVTAQNLKIVHVDVEEGIIAVRGNNVPGFVGGWVSVSDAVKKAFSVKDPLLGIDVPASFADQQEKTGS